MKKFLSRFLILAIAFIAIFSLSACGKKAEGSGRFEITVVDEAEKTLLQKNISFAKGDDIVKLLQDDKKVKMTGSVTEYGFYVEGLCGVTAGEKGETYYWKLLVDGEVSMVGISSVELRDGMKVSFVLVDWTTESWE